MKTVVTLRADTGGFTDDKDEAKSIRINSILPSLEDNKPVVLDFKEVKSSTQSFVHALLGEPLQRFREGALEKIEFRNCNPLMRSLIELVVDYSLGGFQTSNSKAGRTDRRPKKKRAGTA